ncbi:MAG: hypothetical protein PHI71_02100 [Acidiphilium sp.]|jgi:hypothetical protein|nr:hypothetical protein [Acidiphilium sp.]
MDAVNGDKPFDPDADVRAAQDTLLQAEQKAALNNDPITDSLRALRAFLTAFAATATLHQMTTKRDFYAVREVQSRLDKTLDRAVSAAQADVAKAHAEMAQSLIGSIGARASAELAKMSRVVWWRSIMVATLAALAIIVASAGIGYWRGYEAGHHNVDQIYRTTIALHKALLKRSPVAYADWNKLIEDNPIRPIMSDCHGANLAKQDGRTACNMWLWITPYVPAAPNGKQ